MIFRDKKMKTLVTLTVGTLLIVASGCTSTMTVGPKANKDSNLNVSAGWDHVGVTVPFVKAGVKVDKDED
tara:strand:+ start:268 stop:477 length:210 start_codon:yes stop_codon:yes gene_type:complete